MKKELIMLGILDEDGYEIDNRVYGRGGGVVQQKGMVTQKSRL